MKRTLAVLVSAWAACACITTPASDTGPTGDARALHLESCPGGAVDDAEDRDNRVQQVDGRGGYWFSFVDSEGSKVQPVGTFSMADGGPEGSKSAARMQGTIAGSGSSLYAGMGTSFMEGPGTYDATRFEGVSFKAKGPGRVRFEVVDGNTAPEGGVCTDCYNNFGVSLALTSEWETYTVKFADLAQQPGWGDRMPEVDRSRLVGLKWQFSSTGRDFDVWVDEIQFVGCE